MGRDMPPKLLHSLDETKPPANTWFLGLTAVQTAPQSVHISNMNLLQLTLNDSKTPVSCTVYLISVPNS